MMPEKSAMFKWVVAINAKKNYLVLCADSDYNTAHNRGASAALLLVFTCKISEKCEA